MQLPVQKVEGGVLLVGSVPLANAEDVFTKCSKWLPQRLDSIPDGETSIRDHFIGFQYAVFEKVPNVLLPIDFASLSVPKAEKQLVDDELQSFLTQNPQLDVMYDKYAIDSYQVFRSLRDSEQIIKPTTRFQVSIPTATNVIGMFIKPEFRQQVEPVYTQSLIAAMKRIQSEIPKKDLSIQIDCAVDIAIMEGLTKPWWDEFLLEGVVSRIVKMAESVDPEVNLGFHLCYGDLGHQHFQEPKDMKVLVEVATAIMERTERDIDYFHMPVPKQRNDTSYFQALSDLKGATLRMNQNPKLYLGLVHAHDLEGTNEKISVAKSIYSEDFGVSTECGLGRTPAGDLNSIFDIFASVTTPARIE